MTARTVVAAFETFEREELTTMTEQGGAGVSPHDRYLSQSADRFLRGTLECLLANRTGLERAVS